MKNVLKILCVIALIYSIVFPAIYFKKDPDVKEIKISHILVDRKEEAEKISKEINDDFKFPLAAQKYSKDPYADVTYGDIGYHGKDNKLDKKFAATAFKLKRYELSKPVQTAAGWHLIKIYDIVYYSDRKNFDERYIYKTN